MLVTCLGHDNAWAVKDRHRTIGAFMTDQLGKWSQVFCDFTLDGMNRSLPDRPTGRSSAAKRLIHHLIWSRWLRIASVKGLVVEGTGEHGQQIVEGGEITRLYRR